MQTTKKLVLIVLVLGTVFGITFARSLAPIRIEPRSMTFWSTEGLFTTDVDDFLNVNEFTNVMPSKVFGFLGYGDDGESHIQLGFATQLKSIYIAGFFGGMPVVWTSGTDTGDNELGKIPYIQFISVHFGRLFCVFLCRSLFPISTAAPFRRPPNTHPSKRFYRLSVL